MSPAGTPAAEGCVFCGIVAGRVPADLVLEEPSAVAFRDLDPKAPTHVLVVPRQHVANFGSLRPEHRDLLLAVVAAAQKVAAAEGVAEGGYRLVWNVGEDAGNTVDHLHLHLLGGRPLAWPPG